ncbi:unnamed protein product [Schistocephalus solidus]|uniref:CdiI_4 domain-containing protein n=1 Tax=Schistocephalus solidus TaxID=70667 RepID=A0A183THZ7_SCHSO|nr:unnamed protein product [Schistocephalus solidus]
MCIQIDTVCAGVPSFEEFACLFGASHGDHFSSFPIEVVVAINGVRKHERQGIASADGQFVFVYVGPESLACVAYGELPALEVRTSQGYGLRCLVEPLSFRGFLEPYFAEGWKNHFKH